MPPQELHWRRKCWIIAPKDTTSTRTPRPSHSRHSWTPCFLSITCLVIAIFLVAPLYICSRDTFKGCTKSLVFCLRRGLPPCPGQKPPPSPPLPSSRPSSPHRSYLE